MSYVLILGARSDIAKALAHIYAKNGHNLYLAAKNAVGLEPFSADLQTLYQVKVNLIEFDALEFSSHQKIYESLNIKPVGAICAVGYLGDQIKAEHKFDEAKKIINTNFTGCMSMLNIIASDFEQKKHGFIIAISSVAGDRGRKTNYMYGSAKAALSTYLSGLRNRLYDSNVQVLTVKPGFVATKMTKGMDLPERLLATPGKVANDIYIAQKKGKNVIYTKNIWFFIMTIIKLLPERYFKKMNL